MYIIHVYEYMKKCLFNIHIHMHIYIYRMYIVIIHIYIYIYIYIYTYIFFDALLGPGTTPSPYCRVSTVDVRFSSSALRIVWRVLKLRAVRLTDAPQQ